MSRAFVVLALSMLLGIQPVTTDLYLPALPALTQQLGASVAQAQLTLSGLLLAFGLSQLVWGPVSDRFGRRPVLLVGLAIYVVAAIGCTLASSMEALLVGRIVQGVAMGASVMCARALVRDLYSRKWAHARSARGFGARGDRLPERSDRWPARGVPRLAGRAGALAVFGALTFGLIVWHFQETLPRRDPTPCVRQAAADLGHDPAPPHLPCLRLLAASTYGWLFTLLAASSFVFIRLLGLSRLSTAR